MKKAQQQKSPITGKKERKKGLESNGRNNRAIKAQRGGIPMKDKG